MHKHPDKHTGEIHDRQTRASARKTELEGLRARHTFAGPHSENPNLIGDAEIVCEGRGGSGVWDARMAELASQGTCGTLWEKLDGLGELGFEEVTSLGYLYSKAQAVQASFREHVYTWASLSNGYMPLSLHQGSAPSTGKSDPDSKHSKHPKHSTRWRDRGGSLKIDQTFVRVNVTAVTALVWPAIKLMDRCVCACVHVRMCFRVCVLVCNFAAVSRNTTDVVATISRLPKWSGLLWKRAIFLNSFLCRRELTL